MRARTTAPLRTYYRKQLQRLLGAARDENFIQLIWATHILQSEYSSAARGFIDPKTIPPGAARANITDRFFINKWELETLANEMMTTRKITTVKGPFDRHLRCDSFYTIFRCTEILRKLENAEYRIHKKPNEIFIEMGRIAARQFRWQRPYLNVAQFYRNIFIYGQDDCAAYFQQKNGISVDIFCHIGFVLFVAFTNNPVFQDTNIWDELNISLDEVEAALNMISVPYSDAIELAKSKRSGIVHTADRPSILRQVPCLRFGDRAERIRAPLPELLLERITSGLFYDVVDGGPKIRDSYGRHFELYCYRYASSMLPELTWEREFPYKKDRLCIQSPDIICSAGDDILLVAECKATRMSHEAMFGKTPETARGYEDLAKAVFQIWRFFSHCRRGYSQRQVADHAVGVILTLDNWLVLAEPLRKHVLTLANQLAANKDPEIVEADKHSVVFISASEFDSVLLTSTVETFFDTLLKACTPKYSGWRVDGLHQELHSTDTLVSRDYPFADELGALLPWFDEPAPP